MSESYQVEVKKSVFAETTLVRADFDGVSNMTTIDIDFQDTPLLDFQSREEAMEWIRALDYKSTTNRFGKLALQSAHSNDESGVDAYLLFKPRI